MRRPGPSAQALRAALDLPLRWKVYRDGESRERGARSVELTLLTIPGYPNAAVFGERLAIALAGHPSAVLLRREVAGEREAAEAGMHGSPTLLIDGVDPFAGPGQTQPVVPAVPRRGRADRWRSAGGRAPPRARGCPPGLNRTSRRHSTWQASRPARNRIRLVSCRSSVRQAACVYSLIRPLRDLLCVAVGHGGAGNVRVAVRGRAVRCSGAAWPCCSAPVVRDEEARARCG